MGRLLVSGADVARRLVNALAANGDPRRGGDIRHPMRERSPAHLMSHATRGRTSLDEFSVRRVVGWKPGSARAEGEAIYARIARPSGAGAGEVARSAAQPRRHQSITAE
jgi:hypothetical protein